MSGSGPPKCRLCLQTHWQREGCRTFGMHPEGAQDAPSAAQDAPQQRTPRQQPPFKAAPVEPIASKAPQQAVKAAPPRPERVTVIACKQCGSNVSKLHRAEAKLAATLEANTGLRLRLRIAQADLVAAKRDFEERLRTVQARQKGQPLPRAGYMRDYRADRKAAETVKRIVKP